MKNYLLTVFCISTIFFCLAVETPYVFIPNQGQLLYSHGKQAKDVLFYNNFNEVKVLFKKDRITYILEKFDKKKYEGFQRIADTNARMASKMQEFDSTFYYRMDFVFENANPNAEIVQNNVSDMFFQYYLPQCPDGLKVFTSKEITYKNIYPGVDIKFYGKYGGLKYDIIVHPGGQGDQVKLRYEGAEDISVRDGKIVVKTPVKSWTEDIPLSYVKTSVGDKPVQVEYILSGNTVSFQLPDYNRNETLVIDPAMTWSTYFNLQQNILYDQDADAWNDRVIYLTAAGSQVVPAMTAGTGALLQNTFGGGSYDFVMLMFNTDGVLLWATFYGGSDAEYLKGGVRFDSQGKIYLSGMSNSTNIPLQTLSGAHNGVRSGYYEDIFLARFDLNGVREWATMIDTDYYADRCAIEIGPNNQVYIAGYFSSTYLFGSGFTMLNPGGSAYYQATRTLTKPAGTSTTFNDESYIIEFNSSGQKVWATYFGSDGQERLSKITVTPDGSIFLVGDGERRYGLATALPKLKSAGQYYDATHISGAKLYLTKFNADRSWNWSSYYGTNSGYNQSYKLNIVSDAQNNVYIVDGTTDAAMPTQSLTGAYNQATVTGGGSKLYILKFAVSTQRLWATYFAGSGSEGYWRPGAYIGSDNELYVVAGTPMAGHPVQDLAGSYYQAAPSAAGYHKDGILARFASSGALEWSTYVGGIYYDEEVNCVVSTAASGCSGKQVFIFGRTGEGVDASSSSWPIVDPGGGAFVQGYSGSGYYQIAISRFSDITLPKTLATDNDSKTCPCAGSSYTHFIHPGTTRGILSINPNGQNLGNVTATAHVQASPIAINACYSSAPAYQTAALGRRFTVTPTTQPSSPATVRVYISDTELGNLVTASNANTNSQDNLANLAGLKVTRFHASSNPATYENSAFTDNCGNGTITMHGQTASGAAASLYSGFESGASYVQFNVAAFSELWLHGSSSGSPLPVELVYLFSNCNFDKGVDLKWATASEHNAEKFIVEKSRDLEHWHAVQELAAAGNSNHTIEYNATDPASISGVSYYQLVQVDFNGERKVYGPVSVACGKEENSLNVFPNPAHDEFTVEVLSKSEIKNVNICLSDVTGKLISVQPFVISEGKNQVMFSKMSLQPGTYMVNIESEAHLFKPVKVVIE